MGGGAEAGNTMSVGSGTAQTIETVVKRPRLRIRTFEVPPVEFDLRSVSDEDRDRFGLPKLPAAARAVQLDWEAKAAGHQFVVPRFTARDSRRRSLPKFKRTHATEQHDNWSGAVTFPAAGDSLIWIRGAWKVPNAGLPPSANEGDSFCASTWLGLDGDDGSSDVLQAGCDTTVLCAGGNPQVKCRAWFEWFPGDTNWLDNVTVSPGDQLDCLIALKAASKTSASIAISNHTTNHSYTFQAESTPPVALAGNCAEWIVEAFGTLDPLARYGKVVFSDCTCGSANGLTVPASSGSGINMVDGGGNVLSAGTIPSATNVQVICV